MARELWRWSGDPALADFYERALLNGILGVARTPPDDITVGRSAHEQQLLRSGHAHGHMHAHGLGLGGVGVPGSQGLEKLGLGVPAEGLGQGDSGVGAGNAGVAGLGGGTVKEGGRGVRDARLVADHSEAVLHGGGGPAARGVGAATQHVPDGDREGGEQDHGHHGQMHGMHSHAAHGHGHQALDTAALLKLVAGRVPNLAGAQQGAGSAAAASEPGRQGGGGLVSQLLTAAAAERSAQQAGASTETNRNSTIMAADLSASHQPHPSRVVPPHRRTRNDGTSDFLGFRGPEPGSNATNAPGGCI